MHIYKYIACLYVHFTYYNFSIYLTWVNYSFPGFEREMYKRQNERKANEGEAYLWSVADMWKSFCSKILYSLYCNTEKFAGKTLWFWWNGICNIYAYCNAKIGGLVTIFSKLRRKTDFKGLAFTSLSVLAQALSWKREMCSHFVVV